MTDINLQIIIKSNDNDVRNKIVNLSGIFSESKLMSLFEIFGITEIPKTIASKIDGYLGYKSSVDVGLKGKGLIEIRVSGFDCELILDSVSEISNCTFWAFLSHDAGVYDIYAMNDGMGYWSRGVGSDGGDDPEGDRREASLFWYSSMPKPVVKMFCVEDSDDIYQESREYIKEQSNKQARKIFWKKAAELDNDVLLLILRVRKKAVRSKLFRSLVRFLSNKTEYEYHRLSDLFNGAKKDWLRRFTKNEWTSELEKTLFPHWDNKWHSPKNLVDGLMYVVEEGDYLYVGFEISDDITKFIDSDICFDGFQGLHVASIMEYFHLFADGISAVAAHMLGNKKCYKYNINHAVDDVYTVSRV